jgi:hypothetical protein
MASVSGLSAAHRIEARDRTVRAAMLGLKRKDSLHYTQGPRRWDGIRKDLRSQEGECPTHADCSSFATWCLWNGLFVKFKVRDTVNGAAWQAGFTGTMLTNGKRVVHRSNVIRGDCVIYGDGGSGKHTAIVVGRRKSDNKIMCVSHGSESGPHYVEYDYRPDIMEIRRYI